MAQYGGLGLEHLAAYQGHSHLQYLMGHLPCDRTTGTLIRSMLDYTQLECGCTENVLKKDYGRYSGAIMTENWTTEMGTSTLVQLNIAIYSKMETTTEQKE
jgi:hypothetical protein